MAGDRFSFMETGEADADLLFTSKLQEQARVGCLRGDFGSGGHEFWATWLAGQNDLKTQEFRDELDALINALREDGPLKNFNAMESFCEAHPQARMSDSRGFYAFRIDTPQHRYYLRFFPRKRDYNFYIFCYRTELMRDVPQPRYSLTYGPNADKRMAEAKRRPDHER